MEKLKGKVRKIDELGRIVIPIEIRNYLGIRLEDKIDILKSGRNIILRKSTNTKKHIRHINVEKGNEVDIQVAYYKDNGKQNSYIKSINKLGMLAIPLELRKNLDIKEKDSLKICVKDDYIILIKERFSFGRNNKNLNTDQRKERCCI